MKPILYVLADCGAVLVIAASLFILAGAALSFIWWVSINEEKR